MTEEQFKLAIHDLDIDALKGVDIRFYAGSCGANIWVHGKGNNFNIDFPAEAVPFARLAFRLLHTTLVESH